MATSSMSAGLLAAIGPLGELKDAVEALGVAFDAAVKLFDAQRTFDKLNTQLSVITGSTATASSAFKELQAIAAVTPFNVEETSKAFIKLKMAGLDPSAQALRAYGNTAAGLGEDLGKVVDAVADATTGNFTELEKLGITAEKNGGRVTLAFQDVTATVGNNAKEIEEFLQKLGSTKFGNAMAVQASSLDGAIANLGKAWDTFALSLSQAGLGDAAKSGVEALTGALKTLSEHADIIVSALKFVAGSASGVFALFEAGPAVISATTTVFSGLGQQVDIVRNAMANGVSASDALSQTFGGMGLSAGLAEAGMDALKRGGSALMDMFAKSNIGTWLYDNFAIARIAGLKFVGTMLTAWEDLKYNGQFAWEHITYAWETAVDRMRAVFADYLSFIAKGFSLIGATDISKNIDTYAAGLRPANDAAELHTQRLAKLSAAHKVAVNEIGKNVGEMIRFEGAVKKVAGATDSALARKGAGTSNKSNVPATPTATAAATAAVAKQVEQNKTLVDSYSDVNDMLAKLTKTDAHRAELAGFRTTFKAPFDTDKITASAAASKEAVDDLKTSWDSVGQAGDNAFTSIFEKGKDALGGLQAALKGGLLDALDQLTGKKWSVSVGAVLGLVGDATGAAPAADGKADATGQAGGIIGLAQSASKLYKNLTSRFEGLSDKVSGGVRDLMSRFGFTPSDGDKTVSGQLLASLPNYAGQAAGMVGNYMTGSALNKMISGQYQVGSGLQTVEKIGTAVASVFGPGVASVVGAVSGVINRAFGMGNKEVTGTGISGTLSDAGTTAQSYAKWHQKGGWFRSDKNGTDNTAFSSDAIATLTNGFGQLKAASSRFAASLGVDAGAVDSYKKAFNIDLGKDGKVEDGVTKLFKTVGDELATRVLPNVMKFAKMGETAAAVLERLAGDFDATTQMAQMLGKTAAEAFGSAGIGSAAVRERLVELAGGASNLTSLASNYAQNYLTEGERLAPVAKAVDGAMSGLGLAWVTTREQFKQVVDALDLTTEAGARQFASMMQLSDAFAQVHAASTALAKTESQIADERKSLQDQLDELTASSADQLAKQRAALDDSNKALFDQVQAAQQAKDAQDAARTSLGDFTGRMKSFADTARALNAGLVLGDLSTLTPEQQYAEARRQFDQVRQQAAAGDAGAQGKLQSAEQTFLQLSQKLNGGDAQYASDLATVMRTNDELAQWATQSVDVAQASLDALNDSSATLADISATLNAIAQGRQFLTAASDGYGAAFTPSVKPLDYTSMGTLDMAPLVSEIKSLREEVKALRADQQKQTGDLIQAGSASTRQAATTVVDGVRAAVTDAAYAEANSTREIK